MLAPLAKVPAGTGLRAGVREVLSNTTVEDAARVYEAIRLAAPGGLGRAKEQDVAGVPTLPLRDVMALAADRDLIARQYATDFADVFDLGVPALLDGFRQLGRVELAIQHCQLAWLAHHPDSLVLRKRGPAVAAEAGRRARGVLGRGGLASTEGRAAYDEFDRWLRADGHARNPGTTADLVAACLFVALRERTMTEESPVLTDRPSPIMPERYTVRVTKDYLVFCSGHFITYHGERVRAAARAQLPRRRRGRGRPRPEPLRLRLHRAEEHHARADRRAGPPHARSRPAAT